MQSNEHGCWSFQSLPGRVVTVLFGIHLPTQFPESGEIELVLRYVDQQGVALGQELVGLSIVDPGPSLRGLALWICRRVP